MTETKKGLRITAGILLLVLACITLMLSVISVLNFIRTDPGMMRYFWQTIATAVLGVIAAILILVRKFTGAGVVQCLILAASIAAQIISILPAAQYGMRSTLTLTSTLSLLFRIGGYVSAILLIVALFLHNRTSKPLLLISAILSFGLSVAQQVQSLTYYAKQYDIEELLHTVGMTTGMSLTMDLIALVAWILLAAYFGAQRKPETV